MFYTFVQNNSGGSFDWNDKAGIGMYVIVEADNADQANAKAEEVGLYFDGVENDLDCECCGDRWFPCDQCDAEDTPKIYGKALDESLRNRMICSFGRSDQPLICVHHANGRIDRYYPE